MSRRDDGLTRFAKEVVQALRRAEDNFAQIISVLQELNERLTELEEYVADEGTERRT